MHSAIEVGHRVCGPSPVNLWKACKNPAEMEGMINCHVRDGAALAHCLAQLEKESNGVSFEGIHGSSTVGRSEVGVDLLLTGLREAYASKGSGSSRETSFLGRSFPTIAGVGPNGAIVHYRYIQHCLVD
jgi:Xaa-Pro aminopeptidase